MAAHRAIVVSAIGLAVTGSFEILIAWYTGSVALLGDALHNLADVSTSLVVLVGFRVSRRPPTRRYPYGFHRAEDLAGLGIALVIWGSAIFAGYESWVKFTSRSGTAHLAVGALAALVGVAGNFAVARYKATVSKRIQSATLAAEADHSWLDMVSSVGALCGLGGVALGFRWADAAAGALVTLFVCHVGWEVTSQIAHHLMDGVDSEHLDAAERAARSVAGVTEASVRARWMGRRLVIEVAAVLLDDPPLSAADEIGARVQSAVHDAVGAAREVAVTPTLRAIKRMR